MKNNFIQQVKTCEVDDIPQDVKKFIIDKYLHSPEWDLPAINKASEAAGALASWVVSQLSYADILTKVDPLRKKIKDLKE